MTMSKTNYNSILKLTNHIPESKKFLDITNW